MADPKVAAQIDDMIAGLHDWRGELLNRLRRLINKTEPSLSEEWKWSVPVWTHNGLVCAISAFKDHVKMNFFKGAYLDDPAGLFNSGLESKEHRSINFSHSDQLDEAALRALVHQAVKLNQR